MLEQMSKGFKLKEMIIWGKMDLSVGKIACLKKIVEKAWKKTPL